MNFIAIALLVLGAGFWWQGRFAPVTKETALQKLKLAGAVFLVLASIFVLLRGHVELALLMAGGGVWMYSLAAKKGALKASPRKSRVSRVRSAMIEMEFDAGSGVMRGLVLAGPDEGRLLDDMSKLQCERVYELCRSADLEGARLLEAYFDRRFANWRHARERDPDARRDRARQSNRMSEDEAYEVLGLRRGAARDDVVRSHRSLMKKLHPDQGGSTDLAARVNEAKEVLMRRHS